MKKILMILLVAYSFSAVAQKGGSTKKLTTAIQTFQDATDVYGMSQAILLFKEVSDKDAKQWIPNYWTAFVYSQTGRLSESPSEYYDSAQFYLDRVLAINELTTAQQSDAQVLQSLIHGLRANSFWSKGDRENGMKYSSLDSDALKQAIILNRENPRVYLLSGTSLISDGLRNRDTGYLLAGGQMLELAKMKYEANKPSDELYPNWGEGWINFWKERAKIGD